jgi:hypothetical protein
MAKTKSGRDANDNLRDEGPQPGPGAYEQFEDEPPQPKAAGNGKGHKRASPNFILFDEIDLVPKQWLVRDFIGAGETSCWYGSPGDGKSVLIEDFGMHVAAAMTWQCHDVMQPGAVLYIALERFQLVKRRALAFKRKHEAHGLPFAVKGGVIDFRHKDTAKQIIDYARELEQLTGQKTVLIILDTLSRALCGGDENGPKDMGAFVNTIGHIQEATGAHVAIVHHVPHDADRIRGHGLLLGAIDTSVHVVKHDVARSATVIKDNDGTDGTRVTFTLESITLLDDGVNVTTAPVVIQYDEQAEMPFGDHTKPKLNENQMRFLKILAKATREVPTSDDERPVAAGPNPTIRRDVLRNYLIRDGWLDKDYDTNNTTRSKLSNMLTKLEAKNVIGFTADYVWSY